MPNLNQSHTAIYECLQRKFQDAKRGKFDETYFEFRDFGNVSYQLYNHNDDVRNLALSIRIPHYEDLRRHGSDEFLRQEYNNYFLPRPDNDFSATLVFDLANLPDDIDGLANKASLLRRNCYAPFFYRFLDLHQRMAKGEATERVENCGLIHHHNHETLFIKATRDNVIVIISVLFTNDGDSILGKTTLSNFERPNASSTIKMQVHMNEPPAEIRGLKEALRGDNVAYISFVLFTRHTQPNTRENVIDRLLSFRDVFHHHIKETKAALHDIMRKKTAEYLKVLNRAQHPTDSETARNSRVLQS